MLTQEVRLLWADVAALVFGHALTRKDVRTVRQNFAGRRDAAVRFTRSGTRVKSDIQPISANGLASVGTDLCNCAFPRLWQIRAR